MKKVGRVVDPPDQRSRGASRGHGVGAAGCMPRGLDGPVWHQVFPGTRHQERSLPAEQQRLNDRPYVVRDMLAAIYAVAG